MFNFQEVTYFCLSITCPAKFLGAGNSCNLNSHVLYGKVQIITHILNQYIIKKNIHFNPENHTPGKAMWSLVHCIQICLITFKTMCFYEAPIRATPRQTQRISTIIINFNMILIKMELI